MPDVSYLSDVTWVAGTGSVATISAFTAGSGSNRLIHVVTEWGTDTRDDLLTQVQYGATSILANKIGEKHAGGGTAPDDARVAGYFIKEADINDGTDIGVHFDGNTNGITLAAYTYDNVDQTTPVDSVLSESGFGQLSTLTVTSATDEQASSALARWNTAGSLPNPSAGAGGGMAEIYQGTPTGPNSSRCRGVGANFPTLGASIKAEWDVESSDRTFAHLAWNVRNAGAGGAAPISPYYSHYYTRIVLG